MIPATEVFVDAAAQIMDQLGRFGIEHVMLITSTEQSCNASLKLIPHVCCVWLQPPLPENEVANHGFSSHRFLMHIRLRLAALTVRLRYNVMFLDTDLIIFDDPYKYFKQPPFDKANMMMAGGVSEVNIGVMYVQNAAPDGPIAWLFAEVPDRQLRWGEQPEFVQNKEWPKLFNWQHLMWDQANFGDAFQSTVVGRPVVQSAWTYQDKKFNVTWTQMHARRSHPLQKHDTFKLSGELEKIARQPEVSLAYVDMHRPFTGGQWPQQLGGQILPATRLQFSQHWQDQLRSVREPMWPDPDDPACTQFSSKVWPRRKLRAAARGSDRSEGQEEEEQQGVPDDWEEVQEGTAGSGTELRYKSSQQVEEELTQMCWALPWLEREVLHSAQAQAHQCPAAAELQHALAQEALTQRSAASSLGGRQASRTRKLTAETTMRTRAASAVATSASARGGAGGEGHKVSVMRQKRMLKETAGSAPAGSCPGPGPVERATFLPHWMSVSWNHRNMKAPEWNRDQHPPSTVIGHVLWLPCDKRIYKNALKMSYGWYNWSLAYQSRGGQVFFASTPQVPVPKVLAPGPELLDVMARLPAVPFLEAMRALVSAAAAAGRAFAYPALSCNALQRIIHEFPSKPNLKRNNDGYYSTGTVPFTVLEKEGKCMWYDYMYNVCLDEGLGLLPPEFAHLLSTLPPEAAQPSASNTLQLNPPPAARRLLSTADGASQHQQQADQGDSSSSTGSWLSRLWTAWQGAHAAKGPADGVDSQNGKGSGMPAGDGDSAVGVRRALLNDVTAPKVQLDLASYREAAGSLGDAPVVYINVVPQLKNLHSERELWGKLKGRLESCRALHMF